MSDARVVALQRSGNAEPGFREDWLRITRPPSAKPALQDAGRSLLNVDRDQCQAEWIEQRDDGALDLHRSMHDRRHRRRPRNHLPMLRRAENSVRAPGVMGEDQEHSVFREGSAGLQAIMSPCAGSNYSRFASVIR
jgi:hypothetical protein